MSDDEKRIPAKFYQNSAGNQPVRDWLMKLDVADRKVIGADIKTVEYGWPVGMPACRSMGKGLYEVRSNLPSSKIAQILFCIYGQDMVLLHGFVKKTQKTPKQDLDLALDRKTNLETKQ